jgi:TetR/AcrR family transcriptional repressor of nem operon
VARYTAEHKDTTREKIVRAAAKEFRSKGWAGATIPTIMETAGLTVGGFYKHFESKAELFEEMFGQTLRNSFDRATALKEEVPDQDWWAAVADSYLNPAHRENVRGGCVMAALASDMPRADKETRTVFEKELLRYTDQLAGEATDSSAHADAWAFQAMMLGGLIMARGVESKETADCIMESCQKVISEKFPRGAQDRQA